MCAEEGPASLFKGLVATMLREVPAYAGQFGGYYLTKRLIAERVEGVEVGNISMSGNFIAGGVGGLFCWIVSYP